MSKIVRNYYIKIVLQHNDGKRTAHYYGGEYTSKSGIHQIRWVNYDKKTIYKDLDSAVEKANEIYNTLYGDNNGETDDEVSVCSAPLKFAELTGEQLVELRKQITLNSLFISDYENTFGIPANIVCDFFDGFMSYLTELEQEKYGKTDMPWKEFYEEFDTEDNLVSWCQCHETFGDEENMSNDELEELIYGN